MLAKPMLLISLDDDHIITCRDIQWCAGIRFSRDFTRLS
jgi:hypothetical protein